MFYILLNVQIGLTDVKSLCSGIFFPNLYPPSPNTMLDLGRAVNPYLQIQSNQYPVLILDFKKKVRMAIVDITALFGSVGRNLKW